MGLKIYKKENFEDLVRELEDNYGKEELVSIKFDNCKAPNGKVLFWYAVVLTKELERGLPLKQPYPFPTTNPYREEREVPTPPYFNNNEVWCNINEDNNKCL